MLGFDRKVSSSVNEVTVVTLDLDGYREEKVFMYVTPIGHYDMILSMPWITAQDVRINGPRSEMRIGVTGTTVRSQEAFSNLQASRTETTMISAAAFKLWYKREQKQDQGALRIFAASMADINKALSVKTKTDPQTILPAHFQEFLDVFDSKRAEMLPSLRGKGTDHAIELETDSDGNEKATP